MKFLLFLEKFLIENCTTNPLLNLYFMNRFLRLAVTFVLLLSGIYASAVPAQPGIIEFEQPNGYILQLTLHGDEFVHWSQTVDGYTILQNQDGFYVYAIKNAKGDLTTSEQVAHNPQDRGVLEAAFVQTLSKKLRFSQAQIDETFEKWGGGKDVSKRGGFPTTGTNNLIMILANFSDTEISFPQENFENYMNEENYNGTGSFRDYYIEVSYGQLIVNTTVTVWVTLPNTHDYYGPQSKWKEFARDAVVAASPYVDYSDFDNDGNGKVDGVAIIHQGRGQEATSNTSDIWSHSSNLNYFQYISYNGVQIDAYTVQPEKSGNNAMATIGVMCHEFGHNLGAPDYYDTDYEENGEYTGTGNWDIMAGGSYNNSGRTPAHHNPYTKWKYYEWITPTELDSKQEVTMLNSAENTTDFYFYKTPTATDYWLMENRQKIGFDSYVPGHGLLIYHVDEQYINSHDWGNDINAGQHQGFYPVCAFASGNPPANYGNINSASTPFPGVLGNTEFSDNTTPSSTSWTGQNTNKPITNITETGTEISFSFMENAKTAVLIVKNDQTFSAIEGAVVSVNGQTAITEYNGVAMLDLVPGTHNYTITADHFDNYSGAITIATTDVSNTVYMVAHMFDITFNVTNNGTPVDGVKVKLGGPQAYTNEDGIATFSMPVGTFNYTLTHDDYITVEGTLTIEGQAINRDVNMQGVGIEISNPEKFRIFPNPASNIVNVQAEGEFSWQLFNAVGQKVATEKAFNNATINTQNMPEGVYFIKLEQNSTQTTRRLIINR